MKAPLINLINSKTNISKLKRLIEQTDITNAMIDTSGVDPLSIQDIRNFLYETFNDNYILICDPEFVIDISDTICLMADETDDLFTYFIDFKNNLVSLINIYNERKKTAIQNYEKANHKFTLNFKDMLKNYQDYNLSQKEIHNAMIKLDAYAVFQSYTEGYQYQRYQEYYYLLKQINKSLIYLAKAS